MITVIKFMTQQYSLQEIAEKVGVQVQHEDRSLFDGVNTLLDASPSQISFLTNVKYKNHLKSTQAGAVILHEDMAEDFDGPSLITNNPHATFAKVAQLFYTPKTLAKNIAPNAVIPESVKMGENVKVAANVVLGEQVELGKNVVVGANTVIQDGAKVGDDCVIHPNVTLYHEVVLGCNVTVHSQTVIGADGFGFANDSGKWIPVPQMGTVIIGDNTSIGASTCIDRGALGNTIIGKNCIIDNQVQIGHNCEIGDHSCLCGNVGIAGSTKLGKYVVAGGGVGISGHLSICDNVQLTGFTMVISDITEPGVYSSGQPAMSNKEWRKVTVRAKQVPTLFDRVKQLEKNQK